MILLSVDSSAKSAAVAVTQDGAVLAECFENNGFTHSETLLPLVQKALQTAGKEIDEIDAFAVTNGPGSFTGLRIGCAMIKGLAGDKPCYPVPTLLALAYAYQEDAIVIPMMDARRQQTYTATFRGARHPERLCEDRAVAVSELEKEIEEYLAAGERVVVVGDGAYLLREDIACRVFTPDRPLIQGTYVASAAENIQSVSAEELGLRYLRLSPAVREKIQREKGEQK